MSPAHTADVASFGELGPPGLRLALRRLGAAGLFGGSCAGLGRQLNEADFIANLGRRRGGRRRRLRHRWRGNRGRGGLDFGDDRFGRRTRRGGRGGGRLADGSSRGRRCFDCRRLGGRRRGRYRNRRQDSDARDRRRRGNGRGGLTGLDRRWRGGNDRNGFGNRPGRDWCGNGRGGLGRRCRFRCGRGREGRRCRWGQEARVRGLDLVFEILGSDLIQRTRGHPRADNAQFFGFGQNLFVLQAEFL